ncbi:hypothetical protein JVU11DRAFT_2806 [Chiua virens]|nr:hypothetical protein JVU11DRAFT_2806 [Chiua virens]
MLTREVADAHGSNDIADAPTCRTLDVFGRQPSVPRSLNRVFKFGFAQLCDESLGPADYLTLASNYHTTIITDTPILGLSAKNQLWRFISHRCTLRSTLSVDLPCRDKP